MYYAYTIKSIKEKRVYIGHCKDLIYRLKKHNQGSTRSTAGFRPWVLFYYESFETRQEAVDREKKLKSGFNREILKSIAYHNGEVPKWLKGTVC